MDSSAITYLEHPPHRVPEDEGLHAPPPEAADGLFADTVWLSAIDPSAGIWGLSQMHISPNRGYGRYQALFCIDGVEQVYLGKQVGGLSDGQTRWSDGKMSYEVIEPYERIRRDARLHALRLRPHVHRSPHRLRLRRLHRRQPAGGPEARGRHPRRSLRAGDGPEGDVRDPRRPVGR